jgi:hypothetical protein
MHSGLKNVTAGTKHAVVWTEANCSALHNASVWIKNLRYRSHVCTPPGDVHRHTYMEARTEVL